MTGPPPLLLHSLSLKKGSRAVSLYTGTALEGALEPLCSGPGTAITPAFTMETQR